jgi:steroid delta-isomerase-like uncharacterized protein
MAVLSVMAIQGDADELVAKMEQTIDPVARRKAPEYGGISSTVVRTDDGIKIFNLWETDEGRHRMADDPEMREALRGSGFPEPKFKAYEVLTIRSGAEGAKTLARRVFDDVWTQGRLDVIDELFAPDYTGFDPVNGEVDGTEALRGLISMYRGAFPDTRMTVDREIAERDWVSVHWTATGTHRGELMGIAPTGNEVTVSGVQLFRISDGKIVEGRGVFDALGLLEQIGAVPTGASVAAQV